MRGRWSLKDILTRTVVIYAAAAALLWAVADHRKAVIERLDTVLEWGDYPARLEKGSVPYDERQLRMAVRYYKLVAELVPGSDQPDAVIGYCHARLGEDRAAIRYFERARAISPGHFWLDYDLGVLFLRIGDPEKAFAAFANVVRPDAEAAMRAAVLSGLGKMSAEQRQMLFVLVRDFALELREKSFQMMVKLDMDRGNYSRAAATARTAAQDQGVRHQELFRLYAAAAARGQGVPQAFAQDSGSVVLHPWAYFIQPGKERFF